MIKILKEKLDIKYSNKIELKDILKNSKKYINKETT